MMKGQSKPDPAFLELQRNLADLRSRQLDQLKRDNRELRARIALKKAFPGRY